MESKKVSVKKIMEIKDVVSYLEALVDSFKAGKIVVQKADEYVTLIPPERAIVEVEAKLKADQQKFSLELSWKPLEYIEKLKSPLTISQVEPEISEDIKDIVAETEEEEDCDEKEEEELKREKKKK